MRHKDYYAALLFLLAGLSLAAPATKAAAMSAAPGEANMPAAAAKTTIEYPLTKRGTIIEQKFSLEVADPYRWLEDDVRTNHEVADWVARQNASTQSYLATLPSRAILAARMTEFYDYERFGIPYRAGDHYFYTRNDGLQAQAVLYVRASLGERGRILIDPNSWAKDGATALGEWLPSDDGKYLLYGVQDGGSDWRILRVKDVATGQDRKDEIRWVKFSNLSWAKDSSGFYYSRFPKPPEGEKFQSLNEHHSVYFHRLGTSQADDILVHATPARTKLNHTAEVTDDGRYLLVTSSQGTDDRYGLTLYPIGKGSTGSKEAKNTLAQAITLADDFAWNWQYVTNSGPKFTFLTNKDAPRQRLVTINLRNPAKLTELVAQSAATLVGASAVGTRIILSYLGDAKSDVRMITRSGKPVGTISLGTIGSARGFLGKPGNSETFYSFSSFAQPSTIYRFDTQTGKSSVFAAPELKFDPDDFHVEQQFYASKDGTQIPLFIVMKKGLDRSKPSPTLLYGYGGFNISITPGFSPTRLAWLDKGGILAIANLRGGGEYGSEWHDAGRLSNKQNVFDDFIAAGEHLIAVGLTDKGKLAIEGRSNGGLLVGAVVNQRPDLFAAAHPAVGVMDMLRFHHFTAGRYWVDDYGNPDKEEDFRNLLLYSPYHNVRDGLDYPAIMASTADTDDRVVPGHSFKYIAALQAANIGNKPHLIRVETRAGHGSGKPVDKIIAEAADIYAFFAHWTGLEIQ